MGWMGRYRPLIEALVLHGHLSSQASFNSLKINDEVTLTVIEWQVLEYLYEHSEKPKMADVYNRLGIPQSTFSKAVSTLCNYGLSEKITADDNKKNRITRITEKGLELYEDRAALTKELMWNKFFDLMDKVSDEDLKTVTDAISAINEDMKTVK